LETTIKEIQQDSYNEETNEEANQFGSYGYVMD
jgi:hypothetical protein